jgi:hypothetical protein
MRCLACQNKKTTDRCPKNALHGCVYCGMHMRARRVNSWLTKGALLAIRKFQAVVRGAIVRSYVRTAGEGCIDRRKCHNDTDLVTCDEKADVHPYDYFSVEEDGKVWWFDQRSFFQWSQNDLVVCNPYTRTPLGAEDTRRLRALVRIRKAHRRPLYHDGQPAVMNTADTRDNRWLRVCQVLREFGHPEHHEHFISLEYSRMCTLVNALVEDTRQWTVMPRQKFHTILKNLRNLMHTYYTDRQMSLDIATVLLTILVELPDAEGFARYVHDAYVYCTDGGYDGGDDDILHA